MPEPEVVNLDSANAHQDSQDLSIGCLEGQRWIQARPTLLDKRKVKSRRVRNRLHARFLGVCRRNRLRLVRWCVIVVQWNGRLVLNGEGSLELRPEIRVPGAAVPCIPTKVNVQLQQVRQPSLIFGGGRLTAGQVSERIQIDRLFAL